MAFGQDIDPSSMAFFELEDSIFCLSFALRR